MIELALLIVSGFILLVVIIAVLGFTTEGISAMMEKDETIIIPKKETPTSDTSSRVWMFIGIIVAVIIYINL